MVITALHIGMRVLVSPNQMTISLRSSEADPDEAARQTFAVAKQIAQITGYGIYDPQQNKDILSPNPKNFSKEDPLMSLYL